MFYTRFRTTSWLPLLLVVSLLSTVSATTLHSGPQRRDLEEARERGRTKDRTTGHFQQWNSKVETYATLSKPGQSSILSNPAMRKLPEPRLRSVVLSESSPIPLPKRRKASAIPRYVLDLYEQYRSGHYGTGHPDFGNTVRSIPAEIGEMNGMAMFIFNLSSITSTERLLRGHLHLYYRRRQAKHRSSNRGGAPELALYQAAPPHSLRQTGTIIMRSSARGWQWYQVTDAVLGCLPVDREHPRVFAVTLRDQRLQSDRVGESVLKQFVKHHSLPFLILFFNETRHVHLEELDLVAEKLKVKAGRLGRGGLEIMDGRKQDRKEDRNIHKDEFLNDDGESSEDLNTGQRLYGKDLFRMFGRRHHYRHHRHNNHPSNLNMTYHKNYPKTSVDIVSKIPNNSVIKVYPNRKKAHKPQRDTVSTLTQRHKRSVITNKIPSDSADYFKLFYHFNLPLTNPAALIPRNEQSFVHSIKRTRSESKKRAGRDKQKNGRRRRRRKNRSRGFLHPQRWKATHPASRADSKASHKQACSRRRLMVDFSDIGWGDWIISPKSFEAHYCSGSCPFPLAKKLQSSNHATIQSMVHAIGLYSRVPPPCCVPDTLASLTLLYFDEHQNVVLKNYPGMSVQSCACR